MVTTGYNSQAQIPQGSLPGPAAEVAADCEKDLDALADSDPEAVVGRFWMKGDGW